MALPLADKSLYPSLDKLGIRGMRVDTDSHRQALSTKGLKNECKIPPDVVDSIDWNKLKILKVFNADVTNIEQERGVFSETILGNTKTASEIRHKQASIRENGKKNFPKECIATNQVCGIYQTPEGLKIYICVGDTLHLESDVVVKPSSRKTKLGTFEQVVDEEQAVTLTVHRRLTTKGRLQRVITFHWNVVECSSCVSLIQSAISLVLKYVKHHGLASLAICLPLTNAQCFQSEAEILVSELEVFSRATLSTLPAPVSVHLVFPDENEGVIQLQRSLGASWHPFSEIQKETADRLPNEGFPFPEGDILAQVVCGTLEETTVLKGIEKPSEIIGTCFMDDSYFIQYIQDHAEAFKDISRHLFAKNLKFSIFHGSQLPSLLVEPDSSGRSSLSLMDIYWQARKLYGVRTVELTSWINRKVYAPALSALPSVRFYKELQVLVGRVKELEEFLNWNVAVEINSENWKPSSDETVSGVIRRFMQMLSDQFPYVSILSFRDIPRLVFKGPLKDINMAMSLLKGQISEQKLQVACENQLSKYQCAFLKGLDLEAFSAEVFDPRGMLATLKCQDGSLVVTGIHEDESERVVKILKDVVKEKAIRISSANQAATKKRVWQELMDSIFQGLNVNGKKVEAHTMRDKNDTNYLVVLVGFTAELQAACCCIQNYLRHNTLARRVLQFRQPHLMEAGIQLQKIMDWESSIQTKVKMKTGSQSQLEVILSGPRDEVQRAQETVTKDLESLVRKSLTLVEPWTKDYFEDQERRATLEEYCEALRCLVIMEVRNGPGEAHKIHVTGRMPDVEKARAAIETDFQGAKQQQCLKDPQIAQLRPEQLASIQKELRVRLHCRNSSITIEGLSEQVLEAQKRITELLKCISEKAAVDHQAVSTDIPIRERYLAEPTRSNQIPLQLIARNQIHQQPETGVRMAEDLFFGETRVDFRSLQFAGPSRFTCSEPGCGCSFDSQKGLQLHHTQMHTEEGRDTCPKCGKESTRSGITRHLPYCQGHLGLYQSRNPSLTQFTSTLFNRIQTSQPPSIVSKAQDEKIFSFQSLQFAGLSRFTCSEPGCSCSFDTQKGLQLHHTQIHTEEGRDTCPKCGKESTKSGITRHLPYCQGHLGLYQSRNPWLITRVDADSQTSSQLTSTLYDWTQNYQTSERLTLPQAWKSEGVQPYRPPIPTSSFTCSCGRSFDTQRGLSLHHTLMHTAAGQATCPSCGKESTKSGITRHKCKGR
ncbi:uncharacterized protein [Lepisosteus oculatus]|uniref:uncharacterized protein n=1 Tax=Lepisosteus oculatus TaxID=7918 RepID=UPI0035F51D72